MSRDTIRAGNFLTATRAAVDWENFSPPFYIPAEMTRLMAGTAWPGLVSQKQGGWLQAGLGTCLSEAAPEIWGEGIAPLFSFPILVTIREWWWVGETNPRSCTQAVLGPIHRAGRQLRFGVAEAVVPTSETVSEIEEQQQCMGGSRERAHLSCFLGWLGKVFDLASMRNYMAERAAMLRLSAWQRCGGGSSKEAMNWNCSLPSPLVL